MRLSVLLGPAVSARPAVLAGGDGKSQTNCSGGPATSSHYRRTKLGYSRLWQKEETLNIDGNMILVGSGVL